MSKLNTINVVEVLENNICGIHAFSDVKEAEERFLDIAHEHGFDYSELDDGLEDGLHDDNGYSLYIIHSI